MSFQLSPRLAKRIASFLTGDVSDVDLEAVYAPDTTTISSKSQNAEELGFHDIGTAEILITVTDLNRKIGSLSLETHAEGNRIYVDNRNAIGNLHGNCRFLGANSAIIVADTLGRYVAWNDIFFRGNEQFMVWGQGASAVGISIEIEGGGQGVVIGDDALISSSVWIRNHNMHAVVDLATRQQIGASGVSTVIERHVWIAQSALLLKCERIGKGSIIGANSLVRDIVPAMVSAAGTPARVLREQISWGRDVTGITAEELVALGLDP